MRENEGEGGGECTHSSQAHVRLTHGVCYFYPFSSPTLYDSRCLEGFLATGIDNVQGAHAPPTGRVLDHAKFAAGSRKEAVGQVPNLVWHATPRVCAGLREEGGRG